VAASEKPLGPGVKRDGASHQQPQEYQVVVARPERSISKVNLRIRFFLKKSMPQSPVEQVKAYTGLLPVSMPAVTALDLVQMKSGAIGQVIDSIHGALDSWLGTPKRDQKECTVTLTYRVSSELAPIVPLRLKIEINTREHFTFMGLVKKPLMVESRWFTGQSMVPTFDLDELPGTKLRALYQRRKGRDLFDLWLGLTSGGADAAKVVDLFRKYMEAEGLTVSRMEFEQNLAQKMKHSGFLSDLPPLLRPGVVYNMVEAHQLVETELIARLGPPVPTR
jgi:hypothetical protein